MRKEGAAAMAMGFVLIGMLAGMLSGIAMLIAGAGFGAAFLAYAGIGATAVLLGAGLAALPRLGLTAPLPRRA